MAKREDIEVSRSRFTYAILMTGNGKIDWFWTSMLYQLSIRLRRSDIIPEQQIEDRSHPVSVPSLFTQPQIPDHHKWYSWYALWYAQTKHGR